jgi:hypothetical protein
MRIKKLTDRAVKNARKQGLLNDGGGLYLQTKGGSKSWVLRYKVGGKSHYHGLGSLSDDRPRRGARTGRRGETDAVRRSRPDRGEAHGQGRSREGGHLRQGRRGLHREPRRNLESQTSGAMAADLGALGRAGRHDNGLKLQNLQD